LGNRPLILAVDRNRKNLEILSRVLGQRGYSCFAVNTLEDLDQALAGALAISLALVDLGGFDETIWDRCGAMRQASIPFFIIAPQHLEGARRAGLQQGATGMLVKPLVVDELLGLIINMLGK